MLANLCSTQLITPAKSAGHDEFKSTVCSRSIVNLFIARRYSKINKYIRTLFLICLSMKPLPLGYLHPTDGTVYRLNITYTGRIL